MTTSRIARRPIAIPAGVDVKIQGETLLAKGPKGQLTVSLHPFVKINVENNTINVSQDKEVEGMTGVVRKLHKSIPGTMRAVIHNAVYGVSTGFQERLLLVGVGYRAQAKGKVLSLSLGFSHPTEYAVPEGITIETPVQTEIVIKGASKEVVGQVAAEIRSMRSPEPYKGKGIRYANEKIELKETKKK
ncbi:MAG: 50S ribosomal protein L6 [Gammaproteobacteria bacterium RIFCSPHIGHO2_12_FULL_43_28]|nr:MAG: 50S ribosomal protein L6 [Gammaproteobacteria bacterium RIFCSPHIGHO2_12_FULL_43_28]